MTGRNDPLVGRGLSVVKVWYQSGRGIYIEKEKHYLVPELLLKDDGLVRLDTEQQVNFLKMPMNEMRDADEPNQQGSATAEEKESVAELEKLGAIFFQHPQGEIVEVDLSNKKDLTDAGLVHIKGLTKLGNLDLSFSQVTRAGVAELKKALPKCNIGR